MTVYQHAETASLQGYHVSLHGDHVVSLQGYHVGLHGDRVGLHGDYVSLRGDRMQNRVLLQTACHTRARIFVLAESGKFEVAILHVQGVPVFSPHPCMVRRGCTVPPTTQLGGKPLLLLVDNHNIICIGLFKFLYCDSL